MFKPLHPDYAIESVILRLTGNGELTEHERAILDGGYEKYRKAVLPTVNQAQMTEIAMGPNATGGGQSETTGAHALRRIHAHGQGRVVDEDYRANDHNRMRTVRRMEERK